MSGHHTYRNDLVYNAKPRPVRTDASAADKQFQVAFALAVLAIYQALLTEPASTSGGFTYGADRRFCQKVGTTIAHASTTYKNKSLNAGIF